MKIKFQRLLFASFFIFLSCNPFAGSTKEVEEPIKIKEVDTIQILPVVNTQNRRNELKAIKKRSDSVNESLNWIKTDYDLWKSNKGKLGLKTRKSIQGEVMMDSYIEHLTDGRSLVNVIDTLTFKYLGSSFYKDKNNVYTLFEMAGGGRFWVVDDADQKTFKILGSCYAKDKNFIFGERSMKMDSVDYRTFKTCKDCGCFAKDKNGYYFWDSKIDVSEETYEGTLEIIEKLKKL